MARKRRPIDPEAGTRLLGDRLRRLAEQPVRASAALELLVGGQPDPPLQPPEEPPAPEPTAAPDIPEGPVVAESGVHRLTVYLTAREMDDAVFIADAIGRTQDRHVSRSEVIRRALRDLRASLDEDRPAGDAP